MNEKIVGKSKGRNVYFDGVLYYVKINNMNVAIDYKDHRSKTRK